MHQPFTAERRSRLKKPGRGERAVQVWLPEAERAAALDAYRR